MHIQENPREQRPAIPLGLRGTAAVVLVVALVFAVAVHGDEPYARSREYDLQHVRMQLRFDLAQRKVLGEVTHTLSAVRDGLTRLEFDSVDLTVSAVTVSGKPARYETTATKLLVTLDRPARRAEKFDVSIRYEGRPRQGLYFVLPDENYPNRPRQVWTQGEAEDTRYYIPIYDYPNTMTTTEMLVTVPREWITVSNGRLVATKDEAGGMKTWHWRQSQPHATYLISLVAGEFEEARDTWRNIPVTFYVPRGQAQRIPPTFERTKKMLDFFSDRLGVPYPWEKYAQSAVDEFVAGGMENTSATTITTGGLVHPQLAAESVQNADGLISHELAHQWFGDLVTCKDWGHLWLNESFASLLDPLWQEFHYGADEMAYGRWQAQNNWMQQQRLFGVPIVTHDFTDASQYGGNIYTKGSLVLHMLRRELGDDDFFRALKHYLEKNRHHNVVTADLVKAIEEATGRNVDAFFDQWIYGAGAPRFEVSYTYDETARQVKLDVKQTQKVEGRVGLFRVPVEIEITTASGRKSFPITVSQANETFTFPLDERPLMVLFDKGSYILKSLEFNKGWKEWIYQLQNASDAPDRAAAARALGEIKNNDEVIAALGKSALEDKFWGVRVVALRALGAIGGPAAQKQIEAAVANPGPWVRQVAVDLMGAFKDDSGVAARLEKIFREDKAIRVRAASLSALARQKPANLAEVLLEAAAMDSPDERIRAAALRAVGGVDAQKALPVLLEWSAPGKPFETRSAAINALADLDKSNKDITRRLISYLKEPYRSVRFSTVFALERRGDMDALPVLEALVKSGEPGFGNQGFVSAAIERMKRAAQQAAGGPQPAGGAPAAGGTPGAPSAAPRPAPAAGPGGMMEMGQRILQAIEKLERETAALAERVKKLEERTGAQPR